MHIVYVHWISVIRTIYIGYKNILYWLYDNFISVIRTFFSTPDNVLITDTFLIRKDKNV